MEGGFGTVGVADTGPRVGSGRRLLTLAAVMGPGLVVMAADNDAGSLATFAQAGQNYGLQIAWVLVITSVTLFVTQEMVARLGVVSGAGHARLIQERFGRAWGGFALSDLLVLGALTTVTEFIGLQLGLAYFGVSKFISVPAGAVVLLAVTCRGSFRSWERSMFVLIAASLVALPMAVVVGSHRSLGHVIATQRPGMTGAGILFAIGVVGTTLAPWQLFFQQSNVVDKRITVRWLNYARLDTAIGVGLFMFNAGAVLVACALALHNTPLHGHYTDGGGVARVLHDVVGPWAGALFAVVLIDASLLGASAVALAGAYAVGDVWGTRHSLHRRWSNARVFYATYAATILVGAAVVLCLNHHYGLITLAVQALSGALFPSAAVLLLFLANDRAVLGPHVNRTWQNAVGIVLIGVLLTLTAILDVTTAFPSMGNGAVAAVVSGMAAVAGIGWFAAVRLFPTPTRLRPVWDPAERRTWSMPQIETLTAPLITTSRKAGLLALRFYLVLTTVCLVVRVIREFAE